MRERERLNLGWRFALGHASDESRDFQYRHDRSLVKAGEARGAAKPDFEDAAWETVDVPHDWALELPLFRSEDREIVEHSFRQIGPDFPQNSVGWYRRSFDLPESDFGKRIWVEFDGVFRDSVVWINGFRLGRHESGYTPFRYDITDFLNYGQKNVLVVRVDATCYEGWWYEGAGIYRNVWLTKLNPLHIAHDGVQIIPEVSGQDALVRIRTTVRNDSDELVHPLVVSIVGSSVEQTTAELGPWSWTVIEQTLKLTDVRRWAPEDPHLYVLQSVLKKSQTSEKSVDEVRTSFGVRTIRWDKDKGFFLNDRPIKIKGTCNHQHHAGVGIAVPDSLHEWKLKKLKDLGSNAYRCSHYMVTPEFLDAADRVGMLVLCENRLPGGSPDHLKQLETQIVRDRNHPSIIAWSLGNEEHTIQWSVIGERIGRAMIRLAHQLDPTRMVTSAMHDRGFTEGFMNVVDVQGWNYMKVGNIEKFRERMPHQPIVGTEESSAVTTRGEYQDDPIRGYVKSYDGRTPGWGTPAEKWWKYFAEKDWLAGAFVWTGYDYFGEPIPYKWPCTSSHFGLMDLCGFPKDLYYYYKSWWSNEPVLHVFPHWNWSGHEAKPIDVWCYSNHDEVELFLNGRSLGRRQIERNGHVEWKVCYEPGYLEAKGYRGGKCTQTTRVETTGQPTRLRLNPMRSTLRADGLDVIQIDVAAVDDQGRIVPTADNKVRFGVEGCADLLGVGNGDPSSHESNRGPVRSLFHGLGCGLIRSKPAVGRATVTVSADGLMPARIDLEVI